MGILPERFFVKVSCIDIKRDIVDAGYRFILMDVDNTILTRDTHEVPADIKRWLDKAVENDLAICLLSNNWHHGVFDLADRLGFPIVARAIKPLPHAFLRARRLIGANRTETLVIGDQLMTDVIGAHLLRMNAFLLKPLVKQDLPHTLMLRHVEKILLRGMKPEPASSYVTMPLGSSESAERTASSEKTVREGAQLEGMAHRGVTTEAIVACPER